MPVSGGVICGAIVSSVILGGSMYLVVVVVVVVVVAVPRPVLRVVRAVQTTTATTMPPTPPPPAAVVVRSLLGCLDSCSASYSNCLVDNHCEDRVLVDSCRMAIAAGVVRRSGKGSGTSHGQRSSTIWLKSMKWEEYSELLVRLPRFTTTPTRASS